MRRLAIIVAVGLFVSCADLQPDLPRERYRAQGTLVDVGPKKYLLPAEYAGPKAILVDSVDYPDKKGGALTMFYARSINGELVENVATATRENGFMLTLVRRDVPVQKLRVDLVGTHVQFDPVYEIRDRMKGAFLSINGNIEFEPVAGKTYVVRGELKKEASAVWIETEDTHEIVTVKVAKPQ